MILSGRAKAIFEAELGVLIGSSQRILDIGTSCRFAKELKPYENWFKGREYLAAGYNPDGKYGEYTCDFHQDIENITLETESFDAIICLEVLEHVRNPFLAASEIQRVLKKGGRLFFSTPFLTSYHGKGSASQSHGDYPDFWRFTHEGLEALFQGFSMKKVIPLDGPVELRLRYLKFDPFLSLGFFRKLIDLIDNPRPGKATSRHLLVGIK